MFWYILLFLVSFYCLIKSADYFTDSAENIGLYIGIPSFIVGIIIVSIGTSLPELASSIFSVIQNSSEMVVGNVLGSNIANILLVVGVAALISKKINIKFDLMKFDIPVLLFSMFFIILTLYDGIFTFVEGIIAIVFLGIYLYLSTKNNKNLENKTINKFPTKSVFILIISSMFIFFGAKYTIFSAIKLAEFLNIGKEVIAASAIALGTSLPELTVSIQAIRKKKADMALGNIIGSNIFNTFGVLGIPALITPLVINLKYSFFNSSLISIIFIIVATLTLSWFIKDREITRKEGLVFVILYVVFLILIYI